MNNYTNFELRSVSPTGSVGQKKSNFQVASSNNTQQPVHQFIRVKPTFAYPVKKLHNFSISNSQKLRSVPDTDDESRLIQNELLLKQNPKVNCQPKSSQSSLRRDVLTMYRYEGADGGSNQTFISSAKPESYLIERRSDLNKHSTNKLGNISYRDDEPILVSPSSRWHNQPKSYQGANRDKNMQKNVLKKVPSFIDTTDGETSGMGSSVDEPIESSTESASETTFQQPRLSSRTPTISPSSIKKRRGGWPKGRKRKPELQGVKPPKAPLTAYVLFLTERQRCQRKIQSNLPLIEATKLFGAEWTSMSEDDKAVYLTRSEQEKKRYRNELQVYRQSHDYQLALRKKRIKNAMRTGSTTTEESSDFTDEVDDDDSEELYCGSCDQWFTSLHNKREHLNGRQHMRTLTGEYWRDRKTENQGRIIKSYDLSETSSGYENSNPPNTEILIEEQSKPLSSSQSRISFSDGYQQEERRNSCEKRDSYTEGPSSSLTSEVPCAIAGPSRSPPSPVTEEAFEVVSTTEDDYDEDEEYDGEEEVTEEEVDSDRVTDAAVLLLQRVVGRENELRYLRRRNEKARNYHTNLTASLVSLLHKQQMLKEQRESLGQEEKAVKKQLDSIFKEAARLKYSIADDCQNSGAVADGEQSIIPPFPKVNWLPKIETSSTANELTTPWRVKGNSFLDSSFNSGKVKMNLEPFRLKTKFIRIKNATKNIKLPESLHLKDKEGSGGVKQIQSLKEFPNKSSSIVNDEPWMPNSSYHFPKTNNFLLVPLTESDEEKMPSNQLTIKSFDSNSDRSLIDKMENHTNDFNSIENSSKVSMDSSNWLKNVGFHIRRPIVDAKCIDKQIPNSHIVSSSRLNNVASSSKESPFITVTHDNQLNHKHYTEDNGQVVVSLDSQCNQLAEIKTNLLDNPTTTNETLESGNLNKFSWMLNDGPLNSPLIGETESSTEEDFLTTESEDASSFICEETFFRQFNVDFAIEANHLLNAKETKSNNE